MTNTISTSVTRKILNTFALNGFEIETDTGWQPISSIHQTVPYTVWELQTDTGKVLHCADDHIVFTGAGEEIFVKDLRPGMQIRTSIGIEAVTQVTEFDYQENMYDVTVESNGHRYYTNGVLSHNTTIINALSFALYGQALTNIKKDNLINNINTKGMHVTLTFEKDGNTYKIERGRKPNIFKFIVNGKEQANGTDDSQGDMRETQKDLTDIIGMSHELFKHIVALNTYTEPFLSMKANDQRAIIEQLLGITLLSEKAESLKDQIRTVKEEIFQETANIEAIKKANEKIQQSISTLESRQRAWNAQQKIESEKLAASVKELEAVNIEDEILQHSKLQEFNERSSKINSLNKERAMLESALIQAEKTLNKHSSEIMQLQNNVCPACEQEIHDQKHKEMVAAAEHQYREAEQYLHKITADLANTLQELTNVGDLFSKPTVYYDSIEEALRHQNNLETLKTTLETKLTGKDPYQEQIEELRSTALQEINWGTVNELTALKDHQEFLLKLLTNKDSFIRKKIIDQNLSFLNSRLTYYLNKVGLPHIVTFQNDLSVEITQLGQDLDFDNLSRGERNRVILGLSWAFRDVWESLYHKINLLFIDELLDNGLDLAGIENALGMLKKMTREGKRNVYLISHKDELLSGRVSNVLRVIKEGGFTSYSTCTDYHE
jgi:DNA repair exonuclease SbcCD ATPase subunit